MVSYILFAKNRQESGDFKNIPVVERGRLIGKEWRALSSDEKQVRLLHFPHTWMSSADCDEQKYKNLEIEDKSRYSSEFKDAYGYMPPGVNGLQSASAVA